MNTLEILDKMGLLVEETEVDSLEFTVTKDRCWRHFNALENDVCGEYFVSIEKEADNRWIVYAEDHNPEDLTLLGFEAVHKTLRAATQSAFEFARYFQHTIWQDQRDRDAAEGW